eukprot:gene404-710_t
MSSLFPDVVAVLANHWVFDQEDLCSLGCTNKEIVKVLEVGAKVTYAQYCPFRLKKLRTVPKVIRYSHMVKLTLSGRLCRFTADTGFPIRIKGWPPVLQQLHFEKINVLEIPKYFPPTLQFLKFVSVRITTPSRDLNLPDKLEKLILSKVALPQLTLPERLRRLELEYVSLGNGTLAVPKRVSFVYLRHLENLKCLSFEQGVDKKIHLKQLALDHDVIHLPTGIVRLTCENIVHNLPTGIVRLTCENMYTSKIVPAASLKCLTLINAWLFRPVPVGLQSLELFFDSGDIVPSREDLLQFLDSMKGRKVLCQNQKPMRAGRRMLFDFFRSAIGKNVEIRFVDKTLNH